MRVIRNINNNVSLCVDNNGNQVIAFGKGLGFTKPPYEVPLEKIERTFYNIADIDYEGIKNIPPTIIKAAIAIVDEAEKNLNVTLMSTAALALADHINFAIQRLHEQINIALPLQEDIKHLHPEEMKEGYRALSTIKDMTGVTLDKKEASMIALHLVNNQIKLKDDNFDVAKEILDEAVVIIEKEYEIMINRDSFNYSRFATHIYYLIGRVFRNDLIQSINKDMFQDIKQQYTSAYSCALQINMVLKKHLNIDLSNEELLYLMLHINRLCSREELTQ